MEIQLWSDFACPWCALGFHRLDVALQQFEHGGEVTVVHRAFELDPRAPAHRPQSMDEMLAAKYGMSPAQVQAGHDRLTAMGEEVGLAFHFERIQMGNTFDAHRLARAARGTDAEHAVVSGLFGAYFTEGRLLSDRDVLVDVAKSAGLDGGVAADVVDGDTYAADVRSDEETAHDLGITGVPYFLIDERWAVPGAQDIETLVVRLDRAWDRGHAAHTGTP